MTSWEYYGDGETSRNRTQAVRKGRAKGKLTMEGLRQREKGAGWEWWRAKERKATCHPGRFQGGREEVVEEALAGNKYPDMALPV